MLVVLYEIVRTVVLLVLVAIGGGVYLLLNILLAGIHLHI